MKRLILTITCMAVLSGPSWAGDSITAEQLLAKVEDAFGGKAFKEMKTLSSNGSLTVEGAGLKGTCSIYTKAPGMSRMTVRLKDMMDSTEACDGERAWDYNPFFAVIRPKEGKEAAYMLLHSRTDIFTNYKAHFSKWEITGTSKIDGDTCHVLKLTPKNGVQPFVYHVDAKTFLVRREESVFDGPQGQFTIRSDIDKYKKVGGVQVPKELTLSMSQMDIKVVLDSITVNAPLPDALFKNPDNMTVTVRQKNKLEYEVGKDNPVTMSRKQVHQALKTISSIHKDFTIARIELSGAPGVDPQLVRASSYWLRNLADNVIIADAETTDGQPVSKPAPADEPTTTKGDPK